MPPTLRTDFSIDVALEEWTDLCGQTDGLFSLSPLTSPEPSPPASPVISAKISLPEHGTPSLKCQDPSPTHDHAHDMLLPPPIFPLHISTSYSSSPPFSQCTIPSEEMVLAPSLHMVTTTADPKLKPRKKAKPPYRAARQHASANAARAHRREQTKGSVVDSVPRESSHRKYVKSAQRISSTFVTEKGRAARTGFIGINDRSKSSRMYTLEELTGPTSEHKFKLVKWDGKKPMFVSDSSGRAILILAGHPDDGQWHNLMGLAVDALEIARTRFIPPKKPNRRGSFDSLHCGVSFGGGQTSPSNLRNNKVNQVLLDWLNGLEPFKRLAGFASGAMHTWAKDLFDAYASNLKELHKDPGLKHVFPSSIFSAATYNLGPCTVCHRHKDFSNLPYGYCAVTALGNFDPTQGGHLILWELGLVIEFPPGSTILLPSVLISHSNVPISSNERRYSFTQYTAGGIFRWVAHKCQTKAKYLATLSPDGLAAYAQEESLRWIKGVNLIPVVLRE
ncbi:hypothetical protein JR316_0012692 [Psilocybe cubensis]|uniref:Uncharacterized protein n=2 Tax=Psilocybe cubensis TaxID=181762 RepID=A0ACB8GJE9_PSICU|nr:hypothetical protein JR316_0012692 [Psilocybe cubensis]KAH9475575.1 hypothetical protein JR316_0012692 [Psilocybe cubensis]